MNQKYTPGPWHRSKDIRGNWWHIGAGNQAVATVHAASKKRNEPYASIFEANANLIASAPELLAALEEGRRAIGDHFAPNDCYATGPLTGDEFRDLVQCPACSFIAMYEDVIAKAKGGAA